MIPTGLVGCGAFGQNHARVLAELNPPFVGLFDIDADRAKTIAQRFGVRAFPNLETLLDEVQAVAIAVPTVSHFFIAQKALERGVHVLVEKPITATVKEGEALCALADKKGVVLAVGHVERHNPTICALLPHLSQVRYIVVERLSPFTPRSLDVDVLRDLMIHDLEIIAELFPETPMDIRALGIPVLTEKVDLATVRLEFPSGCVAQLTASRVSDVRVRKWRCFSQKQYISADLDKRMLKGYRLQEEDGKRRIKEMSFSIASEEPLRAQWRNFLEAIAGKVKPMVPGAMGLNALKLIQSIEEVFQ